MNKPNTYTADRTTKVAHLKTVRRDCDCGENCFDRTIVATDDGNVHCYRCRNCFAPIVIHNDRYSMGRVTP